MMKTNAMNDDDNVDDGSGGDDYDRDVIGDLHDPHLFVKATLLSYILIHMSKR